MLRNGEEEVNGLNLGIHVLFWSCFVLPCLFLFVLSYFLIFFDLVLFDLVLSFCGLVLSCDCHVLRLSCLTVILSSFLVLSCLVLSCLVLSCLALSRLVLSCAEGCVCGLPD